MAGDRETNTFVANESSSLEEDELSKHMGSGALTAFGVTGLGAFRKGRLPLACVWPESFMTRATTT